MAQLTRRNYLQGPLATLAGACTAAKLPAVAAAPTAKRAGFQLSELFGDSAGLDVKTAKQLGVTHVIAGMNLSRGRRHEYLKLAQEAKDA
jgi:ribosomal protein L13E